MESLEHFSTLNTASLYLLIPAPWMSKHVAVRGKTEYHYWCPACRVPLHSLNSVDSARVGGFEVPRAQGNFLGRQ